MLLVQLNLGCSGQKSNTETLKTASGVWTLPSDYVHSLNIFIPADSS